MRIVDLEPKRVASVRVVSETPEEDIILDLHLHIEEEQLDFRILPIARR